MTTLCRTMSNPNHLHGNSKWRDSLAARYQTNIAVAGIGGGNEAGGRPRNGTNANGDWGFQGQRGCSLPPRGETQPSPRTLLNIVNRIFRTNCQDADAIDATATWGVIVEELKSYVEVASTLALRYQSGMTEKEAGIMLGLPLYEVQERCQKAMDKLRHPCRLRRIRNSIMGWPNLYREA